MNVEQKRACFLLAVAGLVCIGFVVLGMFFGFRVGSAAVSIMALYAFSPLLGRGEKLDERDRSISRRANVAGGIASYLAFVVGCMGVWFVEFSWHGQDRVSVHLLAAITVLGALVLMTARSLAVLILYGRHVEADDA